MDGGCGKQGIHICGKPGDRSFCVGMLALQEVVVGYSRFVNGLDGGVVPDL